MVTIGLFKAIDSLIPFDEHLATFREQINQGKLTTYPLQPDKTTPPEEDKKPWQSHEDPLADGTRAEMSSKKHKENSKAKIKWLGKHF
ncbi:hypothetical protein Tco_1457881 [Tanacetum coccineum]